MFNCGKFTIKGHEINNPIALIAFKYMKYVQDLQDSDKWFTPIKHIGMNEQIADADRLLELVKDTNDLSTIRKEFDDLKSFVKSFTISVDNAVSGLEEKVYGDPSEE